MTAHQRRHEAHADEIALLRRRIDAQDVQIAALDARIDGLAADIKALRALVPSVAAESAAPPDVIKPAVKRATSRAKTASNGETGAATATAKGSGTA